jgi:uncharacterized membrane protein YhaH (DUF805 family)
MWGWVAHCFRNYAVFSSRAGRPEYWWFYLFTLLVSTVLFVVAYEAPSLGSSLLRFVIRGATVVPSLAVGSRRLHDTGHSFWWVAAPLLVFSPIMIVALTKPAGWKGNPAAALVFVVLLLAFLGLVIWLIILLCREGDAGPNRYGDPAPTTPS